MESLPQWEEVSSGSSCCPSSPCSKPLIFSYKGSSHVELGADPNDLIQM